MTVAYVLLCFATGIAALMLLAMVVAGLMDLHSYLQDRRYQRLEDEARHLRELERWYDRTYDDHPWSLATRLAPLEQAMQNAHLPW